MDLAHSTQNKTIIMVSINVCFRPNMVSWALLTQCSRNCVKSVYYTEDDGENTEVQEAGYFTPNHTDSGS